MPARAHNAQICNIATHALALNITFCAFLTFKGLLFNAFGIVVHALAMLTRSFVVKSCHASLFYKNPNISEASSPLPYAPSNFERVIYRAASTP